MCLIRRCGIRSFHNWRLPFLDFNKFYIGMFFLLFNAQNLVIVVASYSESVHNFWTCDDSRHLKELMVVVITASYI